MAQLNDYWLAFVSTFVTLPAICCVSALGNNSRQGADGMKPVPSVPSWENEYHANTSASAHTTDMSRHHNSRGRYRCSGWGAREVSTSRSNSLRRSSRGLSRLLGKYPVCFVHLLFRRFDACLWSSQRRKGCGAPKSAGLTPGPGSGWTHFAAGAGFRSRRMAPVSPEYICSRATTLQR